MRIGKLIFGIWIALLCFSSCYEDKGNYDYKDMETNKVTIRFKSYTATPYFGEPAIMKPTLTYANKGADTTMYKFSYSFEGYGTVSTERDLNHVFEGETGWLDGVFMVTDTITGMTWTTNISVSYQSPYGKGWFILSDEGGVSRLNMVRLRDGAYVTDQRLYSTLYGRDLGTKPYRVLLNTKGMLWSEPQELRVFQEGGDGSVSLDLKSLERSKTLASEFAGGSLPVGFKPKDMGFSSGNGGVVIGTNGDMYSRVYDREKLNTSYFVDVPAQYNNRKLDVQYVLVNQPVQNMYNLIIYDRGASCFMQVYMASYYGAGFLSVLVPPASPVANVPTPDKLNGYENLYSQLYSASYYSTGVLSLLKRESDDKIFVYSFSYDTNSEACTALTMKEFTASSYLTPEVKLHRLRSRPYLFVASGKALYYYDLNTHVAYPYKTDFAGNITCIESDYANKDVAIGVGLDNGDFYLLDVSESAFTSGQIPEPIYQTKVPGRVVSCISK